MINSKIMSKFISKLDDEEQKLVTDLYVRETNKSEAKHYCNHCNSSFKNKILHERSIRHLNSVNGLLPKYKQIKHCEFCNFSMTNSVYNAHILTKKHQINKSYQQSCPESLALHVGYQQSCSKCNHSVSESVLA